MNARRRAARLVAVLGLLATSFGGPAAAQPPEERTDVRVDVRSMSGSLTPETETLLIRARAVNTTQEPVRNLRAGLRIGNVLLGRSDIARGEPLARFGTRVTDVAVPGEELAPGGTADLDFAVPVAQLPFARSATNGVYPLRIEVRSRFEVVGAVDTYVVWWPQASRTLRIAFLWPLVEPTHRALGNDFFDDDLAASVADGRLSTLLRLGAGSPLPLTWAVDPELVDSLRRMTGGYTVRGDEGTSGAAARTWLDALRTAVRDETVVPLPYADPDLTTTTSGSLAVDAGTAFRLGRELLGRDLGTPGNGTLAWPPGGTLSPAAEALLAAQGVKGVVVAESALPLSEQLNYTPTAPTPLAPGALGSLTALVADAQLNHWVAEPTREEGPRVAVQRFLADSAMTAMERPGVLRDIVIAPPRTWDPVRAFAAQLLAQTVAVPWLTPTTLSGVLAGEPSGAARTRAPAARGALDPAQVARMLALRRGIQRLRGILTDPQHAPEELAQLDDALLRAVSSRWAESPDGGQRLVNLVDAVLSRQVGRLRIVPGGIVTMTGRSGRVPVTFENDLGQEVRIRVRLNSNNRLAVEGDAPYEGRTGAVVTIPPGTRTIEITGRATTGGLFPITVEVLGNDGAPLGIGSTLRVRSTAYGVVALAITAGAFGLLLVASATRLLRRRRKGPAEPAPDREPQPA
ncbi:MAG TPA: DUF6049 family protein [Frankiaceae bacterium]|nr:DUF6049 family protein [Frankiaceae bacterium]